MAKDILRPSWVEIDLEALTHNIREIRRHLGDKEIVAVVKADAYGHGSLAAARVLLREGASALAIATLEEAKELREAGFRCPILMMGITPGRYAHVLLEYDITPVVTSVENAADYSRAAVEAGEVLPVYLALDSGMGRIGFLPDEAGLAAAKRVAAMDNLRVVGLFSHFASADEADKAYSYRQIETFRNFAAALEAAGIPLLKKMLSNSAAIMELPDAWYDAVRPGIILYGYYPSDEVDASILDLQPVMSVKAEIVQIKTVPAGTAVSYGRRFVTERESLIGTLPLGYADGYPRALSGKARAIVRGQYAPIIGNICMDQCMVDLTDVPGVKAGDTAILMGRDGDKRITPEEIAAKTGTINYEVICGFGLRLRKIYK